DAVRRQGQEQLRLGVAGRQLHGLLQVLDGFGNPPVGDVIKGRLHSPARGRGLGKSKARQYQAERRGGDQHRDSLAHTVPPHRPASTPPPAQRAARGSRDANREHFDWLQIRRRPFPSCSGRLWYNIVCAAGAAAAPGAFRANEKGSGLCRSTACSPRPSAGSWRTRWWVPVSTKSTSPCLTPSSSAAGGPGNIGAFCSARIPTFRACT